MLINTMQVFHLMVKRKIIIRIIKKYINLVKFFNKNIFIFLDIEKLISI
jgi:hypothetical protein